MWGRIISTGMFVFSNIVIAMSLYSLFYAAYFFCEQNMCPPLPSNITVFDMFIAGYLHLHLAGNIASLLNFIPIPLRKGQPFSDRWQDVKDHARNFEKKYIDVDVHHTQVVLVLLLCGVLVLNELLQVVQMPLLVGVVLLLGNVLTDSSSVRPQHQN